MSSAGLAELAKSTLAKAGRAAEQAVEEEGIKAVATAIESGGHVDPNELAAQAVTNMAAKVQDHAQSAASKHVPALPKPQTRECPCSESSSDDGATTTDSDSSSSEDIETAKKKKKRKKVVRKKKKKAANAKGAAGKQAVGGKLSGAMKFVDDALFDKFLAGVMPGTPGYLLSTFVMLCVHVANMLGVMIYCIIRHDRLYWQITLFAFQDLRAAWNAEFGWSGLCLAILGFAYQMINFFQRTMIHSPRQGRVWFCLTKKRSRKISDALTEAYKSGNMTVRWFWIPAGIAVGLMDASVLTFVGSNQLFFIILVIAFGVARMFMLAQEDPKSAQLERQNTHLAISLTVLIVSLITASFATSMGHLETDWVNTSVGGVFGIYTAVLVVWMIVVGVTRNSKVFDLFLDGLMVVLVVFVSWLVVGSSAYRHQIPDNMCGSTLITGCTS